MLSPWLWAWKSSGVAPYRDCGMVIHALTASAAQAQDWPIEYYDPAADGAPADLVLPMPCGGAMAFQKVSVPVEADESSIQVNCHACAALNEVTLAA